MARTSYESYLCWSHHNAWVRAVAHMHITSRLYPRPTAEVPPVGKSVVSQLLTLEPSCASENVLPAEVPLRKPHSRAHCGRSF